MVKPLTFKGDKPSKKRKARTDDSPSTNLPKAPKPSDNPSQQPDDDSTADDTSWVSADAPSDLAGPVLLVLPSEPPTCVASDANGKIFASEIENLVEGDAGSAEPHDVRQVWVATRVAGTEAISFKGPHGKYLSCDAHGLLSATSTAIAHPESFLVLPVPSMPSTFSLQVAAGDKEAFVCAREVDSSRTASGKAVEIRGDAETLSFETNVRIRMQARFKPRIKKSKEVKAMEKIGRKELEELVGRRLEDEEVKRLRRARREGNFHEVVLDVRVKGKHDKFA